MFKKALLIATFVMFTTVLVYGAANRTLAKTSDETHAAQLEGSGRGRTAEQSAETERQYRNSHEPLAEGAAGGQGSRSAEQQNAGGGGQGRQSSAGQGNNSSNQRNKGAGEGTTHEAQPFAEMAQGRGRGAQPNEVVRGNGRGLQEGALEATATTTLGGTIVQAPAPGMELILGTTAGEVQIGTGPAYLAEIGFDLQVGDDVTISGFWEDGEFKASTVTRSADGAVAVLRDESGRPMWSHAARGGRGGNQNGTAG